MPIRKLILPLLCLGAFSCVAFAGTVPTPESAVRLALAQNPDLNAARLLISEAAARVGTRGRLENPELETELASGAQSSARVEIAVTQRFPLTARLRHERELTSLEIEMARLEVKEKERQLALAVRSAFHELASARESIALAEEQSATALKLSDSSARAAGQGQVSALDAGLAEVNAGAAEVTLATLQAEAENAAGRLAALLGLDPGTKLSVGSLPTLPDSVPRSHPPAFRPDLALAELALQSGTLNVSLARSARWDDLGVGLFTEVERIDRETEKWFGVRVAIPLPLWQNGAGRIAEQSIALQRREHELEALRRAVAHQVFTAHRALTAHLRAARMAESRSLPAARRQLEGTQTSYDRGEIDLETLLLSRDRLTELQIAALAARRAYHQAHAEWLAALGDREKQK